MLSSGLLLGSERLSLGRISEISYGYIVCELIYVWIRLTLGQIPNFTYVEFMFAYWFREASSWPNFTNVECLFLRFNLGQLYFVSHQVGKIAQIPRHGATRIVSGPRCTIVRIGSQLIGGCRKWLYGPGEGIGHQTPFVGNWQIEAMLQSMENDCG